MERKIGKDIYSSSSRFAAFTNNPETWKQTALYESRSKNNIDGTYLSEVQSKLGPKKA